MKEFCHFLIEDDALPLVLQACSNFFSIISEARGIAGSEDIASAYRRNVA